MSLELIKWKCFYFLHFDLKILTVFLLFQNSPSKYLTHSQSKRPVLGPYDEQHFGTEFDDLINTSLDEAIDSGGSEERYRNGLTPSQRFRKVVGAGAVGAATDIPASDSGGNSARSTSPSSGAGGESDTNRPQRASSSSSGSNESNASWENSWMYKQTLNLYNALLDALRHSDGNFKEIF